MGGGDTQTQEQSQNSITSPWARATPLLERMIDRYSGMDPSVTGAQTDAINRMRTTLGGMPDFASIMRGGADRLMSANFDPQIAQMNEGFGGLQSNLGAVARGDFLDPMSQPGMASWMDSLGNDITKRVKGVYAGSGRDPSGAGSFAGSLSRGLSEGMAPVLASQANTLRQNQMDAAKTLYGAAGSTAQGTAGLQGNAMDSWLKGMGVYGQLPGMMTARDSGLLDLANTEAGMPWANMAQALNPALQLGAMGGTSVGTGTTTRRQPQSLMSNILGGVSAGATLLPLMFSDENLKEDIVEVGELNDGQPIFSYRYKGDPTPRIGLIAQEVAKTHPEAVYDVGGVLAVDYGAATRDARGILDPWLEAA